MGWPLTAIGEGQFEESRNGNQMLKNSSEVVFASVLIECGDQTQLQGFRVFKHVFVA